MLIYCKTCNRKTDHIRTQFGSWFTFTCPECKSQHGLGERRPESEGVKRNGDALFLLAQARDLATQMLAMRNALEQAHLVILDEDSLLSDRERIGLIAGYIREGLAQ